MNAAPSRPSVQKDRECRAGCGKCVCVVDADHHVCEEMCVRLAYRRKKFCIDTHITHAQHRQTHSTRSVTVQKNCAGVPPGGLPMSAVLWWFMCCRGTRPWAAVSTDTAILLAHQAELRKAEGRTILFNRRREESLESDRYRKKISICNLLITPNQ